MSTISTNLTGYGYYSSLSQTTSQNANASTAGAASASSGAAVAGTTSEIRAQIEALLADVPRDANGKLTFQAVADYRDEKREAFEAQVKAELEILGVDTDIDMTFSYDSATDVLTVDSGHPDKKLIDRYFAASDELRADFAEIVALTKLSGSAESKLSPTDLRASLQARSVAIWAEQNTTNMFGSGMLYMSDSDTSSSPTFFGLDMMV